MLSVILFFGNELYSQSKIDCSNVKTQAEITICTLNEYNAADKELNILYKKVFAKLTDKQRVVLISAQRKWIDYRDEHCKLYALLYKDGSIATSVIFANKTETTRTRIKELQDLLAQLDL